MGALASVLSDKSAVQPVAGHDDVGDSLVPILPVDATPTTKHAHTNDQPHHPHTNPGERPPDLCFLHFNDVYHIQPAKKGEPIGGAARFASLVAEYRQKHDALVLFSGDIFNPSLMSTVTKGKHMVPVMKELRVDCCCFGNHDFDFGIEELQKLSVACNTTWIMTNIIDSTTGHPIAGAKNSHIIRHKNITIGFIGIAEQWLEAIRDLPSWVEYVERVGAAKAEIAKLKAKGAQLIVALTHMREPNDIALVEAVPEIDLVLGGHDHFYNIVETKGVKILNSGTDFKNLSFLKIWVSKEGKPKVEIQQIDVVSSVPEDPKVKAIVEEYEREVDHKMEKELCITLRELDISNDVVRTQEVPIGNFITDIMKRNMDADCAVVNSGVLRAGIVHEAGQALTIKDVLDILPIEDVVVCIEILGRHIREALENGVSKYPAHDGRFPQVSGIKFAFDPTMNSGNRVKEVQINGHTLKDNEKYKVATTMYLAKGGDGYQPLKNLLRFVIDEENGGILPSMVRNFMGALVPTTAKSDRRTSIFSIRNNQSLSALDRRTSISNVRKAFLPTIAPVIEDRILIGGTLKLSRTYSATSVGSSASMESGISRVSKSRRTSTRDPIPKTHTLAHLTRHPSDGFLHEPVAMRAAAAFEPEGALRDSSPDGNSSRRFESLSDLPATPLPVTNIWDCAVRGDVEQTLRLLQGNGELLNRAGRCSTRVPPLSVDADHPPLLYAIAAGNLPVLRLLLRKGANRQTRSQLGDEDWPHCRGNARELAFGFYFQATVGGFREKAERYREIVVLLDECEELAYLDAAPEEEIMKPGRPHR
eukprot:TRINITY_DN15552_c0_g1_i1.p1 TRINITY_DN15552_c0_g1~~TRINITY_DN15552_c0_g1_i1.p1  ORF type:complete len:817 (-),score=109.54 TRINITY_DN15552_c0_g1_i1:54-2504(-)